MDFRKLTMCLLILSALWMCAAAAESGPIYDEESGHYHTALCTAPTVCVDCGKSTEQDGIGIEKLLHQIDPPYAENPHMTSDEKQHYWICYQCGEAVEGEPHSARCPETNCAVCGAPCLEEQIIHTPDENVEPHYFVVDNSTHRFTCVYCGESILELHSVYDGMCQKCWWGKQEDGFPKPKYIFHKLNYKDGYMTGTLYHDPFTSSADRLFVRMTLFLIDGSTSISVNYVDEDMTFIAGASGNIVHISLSITGTGKSVRPDGSWSAFGAAEWSVL